MCHQEPNQLLWLHLLFHYSVIKRYDSSWRILWLQTTTATLTGRSRDNESQTFQRHFVCILHSFQLAHSLQPYLSYVLSVPLCKDLFYIQTLNVIKNTPAGLDVAVASDVS